VNDSQVVTIQGDWQCAEESANSLPDRFIGKELRNDGAIFFELFAKEPVIVVLSVAQQNVHIVIAKNTLGTPRFDETLNEIDNGWAIRPTVGQVAHEDESSALGMLPVAVVTEMFEQ
jgi:hypothetical protein